MKRSNKITCAVRYLGWVHSHPLHVILFITAITLLLAWQLPGLQFRTSIYDLSVKDLPQTTLYETFKRDFGPDDTILVVVRGRELFTPDVFADLTELSQRLSNIQGVSRVIALPEIKKVLDTTGLWSLEDFKEAMGPLAIFQKSLISTDGNTTVISLFLEETADRDRVVEAVERSIEKEEGLDAYQVGIPVVARALAEYTEKDFLRLPPMVTLVILGVLFILFRNLRGLLIPIGFVFIALIWTFGLMAWTGTPLSMLTMIVPVFVIGVGTAYCMYVLSEYFRSLEKARSPRSAIQRCLLRTGFPTFLAVITTTIGLGSLLLHKISAIREFALFSCFGAWSILILLLLLLPVLLGRLALPEKTVGKGEGLLDRSLSMVAEAIMRRRRVVFILFGLTGLLAILGITRISAETDPVSYFREGSPIQRNLARTRGDVAGCFPLNVVLKGNRKQYFEEPENLEIIKGLQPFLESLEGVDKALSFADYLSLANYVSHHYQAQHYRLPTEASEVRRLTRILRAMVGGDLVKRFVKKDRSMVTILLRTHLSGSEDILRLREKITAYLAQSLPTEMDAHVTGFGIMISESSRLLTRAQIQSLLLTLGLISVVMFLLFFSIRIGLIALIPNAFPILISFGLMGWLGIELSVGTSLVACVAIGLAVDDTIHFLVRYHREVRKTQEKETALIHTIRSIGRPIIFTTLTIGLGFSLLLFSLFQPTAMFGLLMVVTMFSALLGDLILLPSLLVFFDKEPPSTDQRS